MKNYTIAIACLVLAACGGHKEMILQNLDQNSANAVILELGQNFIAADKQIDKDGSYGIYIDKTQQIKALDVLKNDGQPLVKRTTLGEVFKKDSFISSPLEEQARFIFALEEQISNMIMLIDGITYVSTQITLPPPSDNLWQSEEVRPSAAVLIKYRDGYRVEMYTNRIKQLVANAVPGLNQDKVEVMIVGQK
jgi:type III secretion protein J